MDFLHPQKKRQHTIRLFVGYALIAIVVLTGTYFLALAANGLFYDTKTHSVIKNGLIFVDAKPDTATVYVNGRKQGETDARMVLPEGVYKIEVKRDGYRDWVKTVNLEGGSIERLVYPYLFASSLTNATSKAYASAPAFSTQSPDRRWVIIQQPNQLGSFDLVDLASQPTPIATISLPEDVLVAKPSDAGLSLVEWSTDNRHVLLKRAFQGGQEYLMLDRETPSLSTNVTASLGGVQFDSITLRDKKFDQFYVHSAATGILSVVDTKTKQPVAILNKVLAFKPHGSDVVTYVTSDEASAPDKVVLAIREDGKNYKIREMAVAASYPLDIARFDNHWYVAAAAIAEAKTYIYKDPVAGVQRSKETALTPIVMKQDATKFVSFSQNARFIASQSEDRMALYDLETERMHRYALPFKSVAKLQWMDGHRLYGYREATIVVFDFDGSNRQDLFTADAKHLPYFDRDYENILSIGPDVTTPTQTALRQAVLKIRN
jgi:PEGA domain